MKKFLVRFTALFIVFYGALFLLEYYIDNQLQKSKNILYHDWNMLFHGQINEPMIFIGNSRTEAHFDPVLIEKLCAIPGYNLGLPGASLSAEQLLWKSYLANNKNPKIVVQNIDLYSLSKKEIPDKSQFLPYYNKPEMFQNLQKIDSTVGLEKLIPMSKYRGYESLVFKTLFNNLDQSKQKNKGYNAHIETWNQDFAKMKKSLHGAKIKYSQNEIDQQFKELELITEDCSIIKAKLILVWAPQYFELTQLQQPTFLQVKKRIKAFTQKNKEIVVFLDFSESSMSNHKKYFYNSFHMNKTGSEEFCRQFSDSLNKLKSKIIL